MAEVKVVINDVKSGKSYQKVVPKDPFMGKKISDTVPGDVIGLTGYELQIKGGSDASGFPMRWDMDGSMRKKAYLTQGPGVHLERPGLRVRKSVCGKYVGDKTAQINLKITKYGSKPVEDLLGLKKEEAPKEEEPKPEEKQ